MSIIVEIRAGAGGSDAKLLVTEQLSLDWLKEDK